MWFGFYFRFPLSLRMVEEMLAARGISRDPRDRALVGEEVRQAHSPIRSASGACSRGDKWHMDEVVISIAGEPHWLWRAPSIRTASFGTSWSNVEETPARRSGS